MKITEFSFNKSILSPTPRFEKWSRWLQRALPEFGVVHLNLSPAEPFLSRFERDLAMPLHCWTSVEQYQSFDDCLDQLVVIPSSTRAYRQHYLRRWAESGEVIWLYIDGDELSDEVLEGIASALPTNKQGQYAVRVLLKLRPNRLKNQSLIGLRGRIFESIDNPLLYANTRHLHDWLKPIAVGSLLVTIGFVTWLAIENPYLIRSKVVPPVSDSNEMNSVLPESSTTISSVEARPSVQPDDANEVVTETEELSQTDTELTLPVDEEKRLPSHKALHPTTEISVNIDSLIEQDLKLHVSAWAAAWQQQDVNRYLDYYDISFSGREDLSPSEWKKWRIGRIQAPEWIRIELGPIDVKRDGVGYETTFWQLYRASSFKDNVQKSLKWIKREGVWRIVEERVLSTSDQ